jgi:hypothetical protein
LYQLKMMSRTHQLNQMGQTKDQPLSRTHYDPNPHHPASSPFERSALSRLSPQQVQALKTSPYFKLGKYTTAITKDGSESLKKP